jgi:outer membrane protein assembly factor BamB
MPAATITPNRKAISYPSSDVNTALLTHGQIYGFDRGTLKSVDAATGEVRWKDRSFQRGSLIGADGKLIVLGEQGNLALVAATPEKYIEQSIAQILEGRNWTSPTLAGGRLYLRNQEKIVCIDMRSH